MVELYNPPSPSPLSSQVYRQHFPFVRSVAQLSLTSWYILNQIENGVPISASRKIIHLKGLENC